MSHDAPPRSRLKLEPAPFGAAPTLVQFSLAYLRGTLVIAYVPDRDVLVRDSLPGYLAALTPGPPEQAVRAIADDIANELVPKWYRVSLGVTADGITHMVTIEDRQPGWDHPSLLRAHGPVAAPDGPS
jgi:hypothetical protein